MPSDDTDSFSLRFQGAALPAVGALRLIALDEPESQRRRRALRRRACAAFEIERRRGDRRRAKPGIDGLLRVVLADDWTESIA